MYANNLRNIIPNQLITQTKTIRLLIHSSLQKLCVQCIDNTGYTIIKWIELEDPYDNDDSIDFVNLEERCDFEIEINSNTLYNALKQFNPYQTHNCHIIVEMNNRSLILRTENWTQSVIIPCTQTNNVVYSVYCRKFSTKTLKNGAENALTLKWWTYVLF